MVYVYLANGFEEVEALAPVDVLRRAGCEVKTVGVGGRLVTGSHKVTVMADLEAENAPLDGVDMVVLPGGVPGTPNLEQSDAVQSAIEYCVMNDKYLAAICAAPSILGHLGVLEGCEAICYPGYEKDLKGAKISEQAVVRDGNVITGKGAGVAVDFGLKLAEVLCGEEKSQEVRMKMQCQ